MKLEKLEVLLTKLQLYLMLTVQNPIQNFIQNIFHRVVSVSVVKNETDANSLNGSAKLTRFHAE